MTGALQAIVFDFDGVVANSEPLHLLGFQQALADEGIELARDEYYAHYLGYDDVGMFEALARDRGIAMSSSHVTALVARKSEAMQRIMSEGSVLFPGAREFIEAAAAQVPVAIASGALRHEIDEILAGAGLTKRFTTIVAAGDTPEGKPAPGPYLLAFHRLRDATGGDLQPDRCVAIEDSRWGLESARRAGLRCVAVTNSYPARELPGAELIVDGLKGLTLEALNRLCASPHVESGQ